MWWSFQTKTQKTNLTDEASETLCTYPAKRAENLTAAREPGVILLSGKLELEGKQIVGD